MTPQKAHTEPTTGDEGIELQAALPVASEIATVLKRRIDTGRGVRITKTVSEREEIVDEPLEQDELVIERVVLNRILDAGPLPSVRQEGDVTIVPVLEEIIVTEKRSVLKEELRITRVRREVREPQRVLLRSEKVTAEEFDDNQLSPTPVHDGPAEPTAGNPAGDIRPMEK